MNKKLKFLFAGFATSILLLSAVACSPIDALKQGVNELFCNHEYSEYVITKNETCTTSGEESKTCSKCEKVVVRERPATGHNYGEYVETKAPTCDEVGEETRTCNKCGKTETQEIEVLEHNYGEFVETKAPTCTEKGEETRTCIDCGDIQTREIDILPHNIVDGACEYCSSSDLFVLYPNGFNLVPVKVNDELYRQFVQIGKVGEDFSFECRTYYSMTNFIVRIVNGELVEDGLGITLFEHEGYYYIFDTIGYQMYEGTAYFVVGN